MALLELTLKSSLILALGLAAAGALRRHSAALRHWILAATLVCAAAGPVVGLVMPSWTLPKPASSQATAVASRMQVSVATVAEPGARAVAPSPASAPSPERRVAMLMTWMAVPLWLIGAGLNLGVLLAGMVRLTRLRSSHGDGETASVTASLDRLSNVFGLTRPVTLVRSDRAVLVTWGTLRPKVVLPGEADNWSRERLDLVLAHELAHITRGDWLVQTVAEVCKALYWFNPLFWIACGRLRYESERACDDAVMRLGVTSQVYATELLALARSFGRRRQAWLPAPAMAARPSNLERRVRAMLSARVNRSPISSRGRWMCALALLGITLPIATFAQGGFVTFSGTVVDPQDRVLPGATVTVSDARRDVKHETKTDRSGRFELVGLPAGDYTVLVMLPGFRTLRDMGTLNGQSVDLTLKMQVSALQETITVMSEDGSITSSHQRGEAFARRPNPACGPAASEGAGGNLRPPRKIKDVAPGYPGADGDVELSATIGTDGTVVAVEVIRTDRPELGPAAIDAVRQWEFTSTLLNCVPIEVQMNVNVSFRRRQ